MKTQQTVFVGMSGGVDSSVAALRLLRAGYTVVGVFIKVWQPEFLDCHWEDERLDAMRVAAHLKIPFRTLDAEAAYRDQVAKYFIAEYKAGRTPNPDVMCNKYVKFGAFLDYAKAESADFVATGHYAQKVTADNGKETLVRGVDTAKDQSYFLWTLTSAQLQHILLPVGDTEKESIRLEALAAGIPVAEKKDSQGVCFLGQVDIPHFLSHFAELVPGSVKNMEGEVVGEHKGAFTYTIGQRHGFTITEKNASRTPHYVVSIDVENNTVTVATEKPVSQAGQTFTVEEVNDISLPRTETFVCEAQFRYRQSPFAVSVERKGALLLVTLQGETETPHRGQSCVLYKGVTCLGGGIIQ